MNARRRDPTSERWVIIAPGRSRRGHSALQAAAFEPPPSFDPNCPFCPGNEAKLPAILHEEHGSVAPFWRVRVVPNKFPIVGPGDQPAGPQTGLYRECPAHGLHEVIIESPRHDQNLDTMTLEDRASVIAMYRNRCRGLLAAPDIRSVILFRNRGRAAGASLRHPHAQVIALPDVPPLVQARQDVMLRHYQQMGRCLLCEIVAVERDAGTRVVFENESFLVAVPFAASEPFEMWLMPKAHQASFAAMPDGNIRRLTEALGEALGRLDRVAAMPDYNFMLDAQAWDGTGPPHLHWRLRISPSLATPAGFELSTGIAVNPSLPEEDAAALRMAQPRREMRG